MIADILGATRLQGDTQMTASDELHGIWAWLTAACCVHSLCHIYVQYLHAH